MARIGEFPEFEVVQDEIVEMDVAFPDGTVRRNVKIRLDVTVEEEKNRLWKNMKVQHPPADKLVLTLLESQKAPVKMEDDKPVIFYKKFLTHCQLSIEKR